MFLFNKQGVQQKTYGLDMLSDTTKFVKDATSAVVASMRKTKYRPKYKINQEGSDFFEAVIDTEVYTKLNKSNERYDSVSSAAYDADYQAFAASMLSYGYIIDSENVWYRDRYVSWYIESVTSEKYSKLNENISAMVRNMKLSDSLIEAGIDVDRAYFSRLDEAAQLKVTDEALTGMMKFITDKYNSLDFGEIEKSAGDITRFRYFNMILDNVETLDSIYEASVDPGASKYRDLLRNITTVLEHLKNDRSMYATLYKSGNGVVQLLYTSLVAACIYAIGTMVSNTIRFVTIEQDADCEVLFEEIPGSIKHVHFKNIQSCAKDVEKFHNYLVASSTSTGRAVNESVALTAVVAGSLIVGTILLIPRIIMMIREIIYSIYYTRVKLSEMLGMQAELVKTNIESLEAGRGKAKVIARQKKIVHKLEVWQNRVALRMDTTEALKRTQQKKEDSSLKIDSSRVGSEDPADALLI